MDWRQLALLCWGLMLGGCADAEPPPANPLMQAAQHPPGADTHDLRADFPFPVMAAWVERDRLQAHATTRVLTGIWIHEGDPIAQATAYRRALEAAGYRVEPGRLTGNAQIAFAGTATVAGQRYRFAIDFAREASGDDRVRLVFTPCAGKPAGAGGRPGQAGGC